MKGTARKSPGKTDTLAGGTEQWLFRLYLEGETLETTAALANLKKICTKHLKGSYRIEVIDLQVEPERAKNDQILAVPTLVRKLPEPEKRIIGDLSDTRRLLACLDVRPEPDRASSWRDE
jgi:circadian clock protein KaiB